MSEQRLNQAPQTLCSFHGRLSGTTSSAQQIPNTVAFYLQSISAVHVEAAMMSEL
jgi:hypothetical protein